MAWFDVYRQKTGIAEGVSVDRVDIGFMPVLVEQIADQGSTVYTDIYGASNSPSSEFIIYNRDVNDIRVMADKPHDSEPMSNFQMVWAKDGWNQRIDNAASAIIKGLDYRYSYYIVWKWVEGIPSLKAQFLVNPQGQFVSFEVKLLDQSIGAAKWKWYLNDVLVSTERNPIVNITREGLYSVKLEVEDNNGNLDSEVMLDAFTALVETIPLEVVGAIEHQHSGYGRGTINAGEIYSTKPVDSFGVSMLGLKIAAIEQIIARAKSEGRTFLTLYVKIDRLSDVESEYIDDTPEFS